VSGQQGRGSGNCCGSFHSPVGPLGSAFSDNRTSKAVRDGEKVAVLVSSVHPGLLAAAQVNKELAPAQSDTPGGLLYKRKLL